MGRSGKLVKASIAGGMLLLALGAPSIYGANQSDPPPLSGEIWHQRAERMRLEMLQHFESRPVDAVGREAPSVSPETFADFISRGAPRSGSGGPFPTYQVLDLGSLGGLSTNAADINDAGEVAGSSEIAPYGGVHLFLYKDGMMMDLGYDGSAAAINNSGQITGVSGSTAFLYSDAEGVMQDLGSIDGGYSGGNAINSFGQVTGLSSFDGSGEYHAMRYLGDAMEDLGTLGDLYSVGYGINDAGEVAGVYQREFETHAFLYSSGLMIDLVPGSSSFIDSLSKPINSRGEVAGSYLASGVSHAFLYRHGAAIDLGTLGGEFSTGTAINDAAQVTGDATTSSGDAHAFLYSKRHMRDLGTLGGTFSIGYAINKFGHVTGFSTTEDGAAHAFVYRDGEMVDLGSYLGSDQSVGRAINKHGQVVGYYRLLSDDPFDPYYYRGFIATPISLLFSRLLDDVSDAHSWNASVVTIRFAQRFFAVKNLRGTCSAVRVLVFVLHQEGNSPSRKSQAKKFIADTKAIELALGCD